MVVAVVEIGAIDFLAVIVVEVAVVVVVVLVFVVVVVVSCVIEPVKDPPNKLMPTLTLMTAKMLPNIIINFLLLERFFQHFLIFFCL